MTAINADLICIPRCCRLNNSDSDVMQWMKFPLFVNFFFVCHKIRMIEKVYYWTSRQLYLLSVCIDALITIMNWWWAWNSIGDCWRYVREFPASRQCVTTTKHYATIHLHFNMRAWSFPYSTLFFHSLKNFVFNVFHFMLIVLASRCEDRDIDALHSFESVNYLDTNYWKIFCS